MPIFISFQAKSFATSPDAPMPAQHDFSAHCSASTTLDLQPFFAVDIQRGAHRRLFFRQQFLSDHLQTVSAQNLIMHRDRRLFSGAASASLIASFSAGKPLYPNFCENFTTLDWLTPASQPAFVNSNGARLRAAPVENQPVYGHFVPAMGKLADTQSYNSCFPRACKIPTSRFTDYVI